MEVHHLRDAVKKISAILLLWVEEAVLWVLACGVARSVVGNSWPPVAPTSDANQGGLNGSAPTQWFVVIRDCNPRAPHLLMPLTIPEPIPQVRNKPDIRVSWEFHQRVCSEVDAIA
jgi:hypothetical protein